MKGKCVGKARQDVDGTEGCVSSKQNRVDDGEIVWKVNKRGECRWARDCYVEGRLCREGEER